MPENLLVWTTTPWTLTSNVGAAVNPELLYLKIKQGNQIYYVGKAAFKTARLEEQFKAKEWVDGVPKLKTLEQMFKEKSKEGFEIVGEVKGEELVGRTYDGPFDEFEAQNTPYGYPDEIARVVKQQKWSPAISGKQAHRVVAWKDVGETEGTGIVHIAPGCGKEDFALGKEVGLPPVAPLDESGLYQPGFGPLTGKLAASQDVVDYVVNSLKEKGLLFATEMYPHKYPHCWRCKQELLYRLVDEWFIHVGPSPRMTDSGEVWPGNCFRTEIKQVTEQAVFLPEELNGKARELDWLRNMGDWMISKKRYWGLALPIWVDHETGEFEVIGSRQELNERAVEGWNEFDGKTPHRPWIDKIKIKSKKTGKLLTRIGDVGNPWLDAGIVAFSTMGFNRDREYWKQWYPADFITESFPGQFRNWFYALLALSTVMGRDTEKSGLPPFKSLLGHGLVLDEKGETMSKSKGNSIAFDEAADKMGADVCRWLYCRSAPSSNIHFGFKAADELRAKFVLKLWNTYAFFVNYARLDGFDPAKPQAAELQDIDRWILSDLQLLIKKARESFEAFDVQAFCLETEKFVDDKLSNWYIRRNRRRFWKSEAGSDKMAAYQTLYTVLTTLTKLIAPVVPFLAETMWQTLKPVGSPQSAVGSEESVHLCAYPVADEKLIDQQLSEDMEALLRLVSLGGAARNVAKIKVRQPLAELRVQPANDADRRAVERFADQVQEELNVKRATLHVPSPQLLRTEIKLNMKTAGPKFGAKLKDVQGVLAVANALRLSEQLRAGPVELSGMSVELADVSITYSASEGWAGVADRGTQVALDTRITPELSREGMARDVIRQVQDLRKNADLQMEDRIVLCLATDSAELKLAIETHRNYIAAETLTKEWVDTPFEPHSAKVKIDGQALTIALRKT